jgi:hypothetical protein
MKAAALLISLMALAVVIAAIWIAPGQTAYS